MIEQAKQVAQRLREYGTKREAEAANTIDALVAEVERLTKVDVEPDLATMLRNLVRICRRHIEDDHPDLIKANDYLKWLQSKGLAGSPLRDGEQK